MGAVEKEYKEVDKRCARGNTKLLRTRNKGNDKGNERDDAATTETDATTDENANAGALRLQSRPPLHRRTLQNQPACLHRRLPPRNAPTTRPLKVITASRATCMPLAGLTITCALSILRWLAIARTVRWHAAQP